MASLWYVGVDELAVCRWCCDGAFEASHHAGICASLVHFLLEGYEKWSSLSIPVHFFLPLREHLRTYEILTVNQILRDFCVVTTSSP